MGVCVRLTLLKNTDYFIHCFESFKSGKLVQPTTKPRQQWKQSLGKLSRQLEGDVFAALEKSGEFRVRIFEVLIGM